MKKVNIFLSFVDKDLEKERLELSNFIRDLNDKYDDLDVYFKLITNEKEVDREVIESSDLFLVILEKDIQSRFIDEFNIAYEKFKESNLPKISTFIKKETTDISKELADFLKRLDEEIGHYYSVYENVDTIKLNIILKLNTLGITLSDLEVKDSKIYSKDETLICLDNIPMIFNNQNLQNLKRQYKDIYSEFLTLKENRDNSDADYNKYIEIKNQKDKIEKNIFELEKNILNLEISFTDISSQGSMSKRQIYAKRCLDRGDVESAIEALDFKELKSDSDRLLFLSNSYNKNIDILVNECLQKIDILIEDVENENRFNEIDDLYNEAISLEKEKSGTRDVLLSYAIYLKNNHRYEEAYTIAKQYYHYLKLEELTINKEICELLYNCSLELKKEEEAKFYMSLMEELS